MKIYEKPMLDISMFLAENVVTDSTIPGPEPNAYSQAQDTALNTVGKDRMFTVTF